MDTLSVAVGIRVPNRTEPDVSNLLEVTMQLFEKKS